MIIGLPTQCGDGGNQNRMYSPVFAYGYSGVDGSGRTGDAWDAHRTAAALASAAVDAERDSIFDSPHSPAAISSIELLYRRHATTCILCPTVAHDCIALGCKLRRLSVRIHRRRNVPVRVETDEAGVTRLCHFDYHTCMHGACECARRKTNHVCYSNWNGGECWHPSKCAPADVYEYTALYVCTRSGRVHPCGDQCRERHTQLARGGVHVCPLTGICLGSVLEADAWDAGYLVSPGSGQKAIDYGDHEEDDEDDEYNWACGADGAGHDAAAPVTDRRRGQGMLEAPVARAAWDAGMTAGELGLMQKKRERAIDDELGRFAPGNVDVGDVLRPLESFRGASHRICSRASLGQFYAMLLEVSPLPFHPAWHGQCIGRRGDDATWKRLERVVRPARRTVPGVDSVRAAALKIYGVLDRHGLLPTERVDKVVPLLLSIMKKGVWTGATEVVAKHEMDWYSPRRRCNTVRLDAAIAAAYNDGTITRL
jgi:hypothetical protein